MTGAPADPLARLRTLTSARVALGRSGEGLPTRALLAFQRDHALARDAVHAPFDPGRVAAQLAPWPTLDARSRAGDRGAYLRRPDLGRRLDEASARALAAAAAARFPPGRAPGAPPGSDIDLALVIADGLSPPAVHAHAAAVASRLVERLRGWSISPVVLAAQARVALGDEIGAALGARLVLVLIGERPGLSAPDSLGAYLTWNPAVGRLDSERNCVSNIRPPGGLGYGAAADTLAWLLRTARERALTGVGLKDESGGGVLPGPLGPGPTTLAAPATLDVPSMVAAPPGGDPDPTSGDVS
jgi:ethanolamine ammonia-lyase small subunit